MQNNTDVCLILNFLCIFTNTSPSKNQSENYIIPAAIFGNQLSKCPDIQRKRRPISHFRVPPDWSNKVKTYFSSVGSPWQVAKVFRDTPQNHTPLCKHGLIQNQLELFLQTPCPQHYIYLSLFRKLAEVQHVNMFWQIVGIRTFQFVHTGRICKCLFPVYGLHFLSVSSYLLDPWISIYI